MKTPYSKFPVFVQKNKKESRCDGYYSSTEKVRSLISATTNLSLNNTSKYYFLIFTNSFSSLKNLNNKLQEYKLNLANLKEKIMPKAQPEGNEVAQKSQINLENLLKEQSEIIK